MDVKRIVQWVLLGSTLGIVFFVFYVLLSTSEDDVPDAPVVGWRGNSYSGLVVQIDEKSLILHTESGDNRVFKLDANTGFLLRGNMPVRPGIEVKVQFRNIRGPEGTYMLARTVRVLRTEPESPLPSGSAGPVRTPRPLPSAEASSATSGSDRSRAAGSPAPVASGSPLIP